MPEFATPPTITHTPEFRRQAGPRFVWPPKPVEVETADSRPDHRLETLEASPPLSSRPGGLAAIIVGLRTWARAAEQEWLGVADVAWHEAAEQAGWEADVASTYCPRCGTSAGPFEADADGCPACRTRRLAWDRCVRLGAYEGVLRDAILAAKYTAWRRVGQELGTDLGKAVAAALGQSGIAPASVCICPIATSRRRRLARGVDQTVILAREVAKQTGGTLVRGLTRKHRPPQTGLSVNARQKNTAKSFVARPRVCRKLAGRTVVLVDDVRTTGATLSAAGRALKRGVGDSAGGGAVTLWAAVAAVTPRHSA
ncbi:MAG: phosphoribosyltransferase family protein [Planctomycetota bacterium]|nr:phosphoribosyltransferase family protein [Planctomycetota bacterium]